MSDSSQVFQPSHGAAGCRGLRSGRTLLSATLLAALLASPLNAAAPGRADLEGPFHETVREEVDVSGTVVAGVAATAALSGEAALSGLMVPGGSEAICLTLLSRDGVYYSRNGYRMPVNSADAMVVLPYADFTKERERISRYSAGDLAIKVTPGSCDQAPATYLVPATDAPSGSVDILINAFGANDVYFLAPDGSEGECMEFTEGRRTSYAFRCRVPVESLGPSGNGRKQVIIEREIYGRPLKQVTVELQLEPSP